jgi:hypothetical protein
VLAASIGGSTQGAPMRNIDRDRIPELSIVALKRALTCRQGVLPKGAQGTVVFVHREGTQYEVEFDGPIHCVATVAHSDLRQV